MSRRIDDLVPRALFKAAAALAVLKRAGEPVVVTSTLRTADEQAALYAQGRKPLDEVNRLRATAKMRPLPEAENKYTVTHCDGIVKKSNHQSGRALDVVPANAKGDPIWPGADDPRWGWIAEAFKEQGFVWGGDWTRPHTDRPHYELPPEGDIP